MAVGTRATQAYQATVGANAAANATTAATKRRRSSNCRHIKPANGTTNNAM